MSEVKILRNAKDKFIGGRGFWSAAVHAGLTSCEGRWISAKHCLGMACGDVAIRDYEHYNTREQCLKTYDEAIALAMAVEKKRDSG